MDYNDVGLLLTERYTAGILSGIGVTNVYDHLLRRTNVATLGVSTGYKFDNASRLSQVLSGTNSASYAYLANSPLVSQITFTNGSALRMTTTKQYDLLNRLTSITNLPSASSAIGFRYAYNDANQRTSVTNTDTARWVYQYDSLGQVMSGKKYWSDGTPVAGQQFEYNFDDIGNRKLAKTGGDAAGANLRQSDYSANNLNQTTSRTVPGFVNVLGTAKTNATVTLWGDNGALSATARKGDYFQGELGASNTANAVWLTLTNLAVLSNGSNPDIVTNTVGRVFVPQTSEMFYYDLDGNLTNDGRWIYTWDAENRLLQVESKTTAPTASKRKVVWTYDGSGRRMRQTTYDGATGSYVATEDLKFLADGWRHVVELNATNNALLRTYVWGLDLSGSLDGAGGVGGLLFLNSTANGNHYYAYDGNGNVTALAKASDGSISQQCEYEPFGKLIRNTGLMAGENRFLFSTKRWDATTDFLLYEHRVLRTDSGKWLSRDPIGEQGGRNLYGFVRNDPVQFVDTDGRQLSPPLCNTCGQVALPGHKCVPLPPPTPPDPTGFALCIRDVNPEGLAENALLIGFRILHPQTPTDHAYLHYKHCDKCERVGWGIGGTKPGAPPKNETVFKPTDCKPCKKTESLLQYGAPGKKGTEATDSEILDCISEVPTSKNYKPTGKGHYNCMDWAKEAASKCGLDCN